MTLRSRVCGRLRHTLSQFCPTARNVLIRRSLARLDLAGVDRVLVVGAGGDPYHDLFRRPSTYVRSDLVAVPGRTDTVADAAALPFRDRSFQCVLVTEVLEY